MLDIPLAKLGFLVAKAREWSAKVAPVAPDPGSNPTDDGDREILEDLAGDSTEEELRDAILSLNQDEREEVIALAWVGRGDFDRSQWRDALAQARSERERDPALYLMGMPQLGDLLEDGAAALGYSLTDYEARSETGGQDPPVE